jgi:hypothetical protein
MRLITFTSTRRQTITIERKGVSMKPITFQPDMPTYERYRDEAHQQTTYRLRKRLPEVKQRVARIRRERTHLDDFDEAYAEMCAVQDELSYRRNPPMDHLDD